MASSGSSDTAERIKKQTAQYLADHLTKKVREVQDELTNVRLAMGQEQSELQSDVRALLDYIMLSYADKPLPDHIAEIIGRHEERRIEAAVAREADRNAGGEVVDAMDVSGVKYQRVTLMPNGGTISLGTVSGESVFKI